MLTIAGQTDDGRLVFRGVYRFYETHGLPLEDIIYIIVTQNKALVDWIDFYEDAVKAGMKPHRVLNRLEMVCCDAVNSEFANEVLSRLKAKLV